MTCEGEECSREATHRIVYNPIGLKHYPREYCEVHANEAVVRGRRKELTSGVYLGPFPIEA